MFDAKKSNSEQLTYKIYRYLPLRSTDKQNPLLLGKHAPTGNSRKFCPQYVYTLSLFNTKWMSFATIAASRVMTTQVTFARNCFPISARIVLDTPEIVDLCLIKCVESAKIW